MIQLMAQGGREIWPDAMVVQFGGQAQIDPYQVPQDDYYCGGCRHFHDEGGACGPQGPCGRYDCCIN